MTTLHRRWSSKASSVHTKEDDGGVAACLNWSYGNRPRKVIENDVKNQAIKLQDAVDKVLGEHCSDNKVNMPSAPEKSYTLPVQMDRRVLSPRDNFSRYEKPATPDIELIKKARAWSRTDRQTPGMTHDLDRRPPTPAARAYCDHVRPTQRVQAWSDQSHPQPTRSDENDNNQKAPLGSTKKFLKKYFNRPLSDNELRYVLKETHKRISDDIVEDTLAEKHTGGAKHTQRGKVPQPPPTKSCSMHNRNGRRQPVKALAIPQKNFMFQANNERKRPASAQYVPQDNTATVRWDSTVRSRPGSAAYPARGNHFSTWRANDKDELAHYPWTQSTNNYDDLWRLASKYKQGGQSKRLGSSRFNNSHMDAERDYLQSRPASQQGKVNVQLDCPDDTDMTVSVRVQKSRASMRY